MTCPHCGSTDIRSSKRAHLGDAFQRFRGLEPFRCRKCRKRFFASESSLSDGERIVVSKATHRPVKLMSVRKKQRLVRQLTVIGIFAVAFVLFYFFLRYLIREPKPASDTGAVGCPVTCSRS
jgi:hypothetical protein